MGHWDAEPADAGQPAGGPPQAAEPVLAELVSPPPRGLAALVLDPSRRLRTLWRLLIFAVGYLVVQLVAGIFAAIGLVVYLAAGGDEPRVEDVMELLQGSSALVLALASPPLALLSWGLAAGCRRLVDRRSIASMGFVWPTGRWLATVPAGLILGAAPVAAGLLLVVAVGGFHLRPGSLSAGVVLMVPCLVLAAFHEEVVFRAYVLRNLLDIHWYRSGVVLSSVVFWLVHSLNPHAWSSPLVGLNLFGAGVILSLAYLVSGNIWMPTAMHFAWNFAQGPLFSTPVSGIGMSGLLKLQRSGTVADWLTGGQFGFEGSAVCTVAEVLLIGFLLVALRRSRAVGCAAKDAAEPA